MSPDDIKVLLAQTQKQIDEVKLNVQRSACKDDYEHGWNNGAFFVLVELRRALKEALEESS